MMVLIAVKTRDDPDAFKTIEQEVSKVMSSHFLERSMDSWEIKSFRSLDDFMVQMLPSLSCRGEIKTVLKNHLTIKDV